MAFCVDLTKTVCVNFIHDRALQLCPPSFQIGDPWGGSYLMEALTDQVYESGFNITNEVQEVHLKISIIVLKAKHMYNVILCTYGDFGGTLDKITIHVVQ